MTHYIAGAALMLGLAFAGGCPTLLKLSGMTLVGLMVPREPNEPHRLPTACAKSGAPCPIPEAVTTSRAELHERAEQKRVAASPTEVHANFDLHIVEFDDQGAFFNPAAAAQSIACVEQAAQPQLTPTACANLPEPPPPGRKRTESAAAIIVTFVHGWEHNGKVCDDNLTCFREALELIAQQEAVLAESIPASIAWKPRRVVGVYVAWRGRSLTTPGVSKTDFWWRKDAAHRIGGGTAAVALFSALASVQHRDSTGRTRLVLIGHSFGAALLYEAISSVLMEKAVHGRAANATELEGVGDLVVLINPAFEAGIYSGFDELTRTGKFTDKQAPLILTVSAENDGATRDFFPIGRWLSKFIKGPLRKGQYDEHMTTLGNHEPFRTHELVYESRLGPEPLKARNSAKACGCRADVASLLSEPQIFFGVCQVKTLSAAPLALGSQRSFGAVILKPYEARPIDPNAPYIVASADKEVIDGHSGMFNPRFIRFLIQYVAMVEIKKLDPLVVEGLQRIPCSSAKP